MFLTRAACILLVGRALMELMGILEETLGFHISRLFESDPPCIARVGLFLNIIRGPSTPYARKHEPKIPTHAAAEERKVPSPTWDFYKESGTGSKQQPTSGTSATGVGPCWKQSGEISKKPVCRRNQSLQQRCISSSWRLRENEQSRKS